MPRPKLDPHQKRSVSVMVRMRPAAAEWLDKVRGSKSRAEYIRDLLTRESKK